MIKRILCLASVLGFSHPVFAFTNCVIIARRSTPAGALTKWYSCNEGIISLTGEWSIKQNQRHEFGTWTFGETTDFGTPPAKVTQAFTKCVAGQGTESNYDGYMSTKVAFDSAEGPIMLKGQWGDEYQGHWEYRLELGEVTSQPTWVNDPAKIMDFTSSFQKWCPTQHGFRLCGWIEEPRVDHGSPPPYQR
jgi:hypothetical protein